MTGTLQTRRTLYCLCGCWVSASRGVAALLSAARERAAQGRRLLAGCFQVVKLGIVNSALRAASRDRANPLKLLLKQRVNVCLNLAPEYPHSSD